MLISYVTGLHHLLLAQLSFGPVHVPVRFKKRLAARDEAFIILSLRLHEFETFIVHLWKHRFHAHKLLLIWNLRQLFVRNFTVNYLLCTLVYFANLAVLIQIYGQYIFKAISLASNV